MCAHALSLLPQQLVKHSLLRSPVSFSLPKHFSLRYCGSMVSPLLAVVSLILEYDSWLTFLSSLWLLLKCSNDSYILLHPKLWGPQSCESSSFPPLYPYRQYHPVFFISVSHAVVFLTPDRGSISRPPTRLSAHIANYLPPECSTLISDK